MNDELRSLLKDYTAVSSMNEVLGWDQETMMPSDGLQIRKAQLGYLSQQQNNLLQSDEFAEALDRFDDRADTPEQRAIVRELRRKQRRVANVPSKLMKDLQGAAAEGVEAWRRAREEEDFSLFADDLERLVDLNRRYAEHIDPDSDPYEVLFHEYEPHLGLERVDNLFDTLTDELPPRLETIRQADTSFKQPYQGSFDTDTQRRLSQEVIEALGLDTNEVRLDISTHPFTVGNPCEARITTRLDEADLTEGLNSTIHESGHALYFVNCDEENWWNPLGWHRGLTVHESQSRFYENHVWRSKAFHDYLKPVIDDFFDDVEAFSSREAYQAVNRVKPENHIRVEADELTYHLHVAIRYELGRSLINGELSVDDLQRAWRDKSEAYLGLTPPSPAKGVLQDIHWSQGMLGYFPTYTTGSMLAAQINEAIRDDVDVDAAIRTGRFEDILGWLRSAVHQHGQRYTTPGLIERVTGDGLSADAYLDHIDERLEDVYGVDL